MYYGGMDTSQQVSNEWAELEFLLAMPWTDLDISDRARYEELTTIQHPQSTTTTMRKVS